MSELAEPLIPPLVAAAVAAVSWGLIEHLVVHSEQRGVVWGLAALVCEGLGFLVTYGAVLLVISPATRSRFFRWWSSPRRSEKRRSRRSLRGRKTGSTDRPPVIKV
jgi:hypothetical protein